ncbi:MAG: PfkB family carbohydrate kinase [Anaerolineae bacterium]|nr:PfkB family carbohydrate kinase [Anaerolineae bacterium]
MADSLRLPANAPYRLLVGVGGIGTGLFFALEGDHTLGRNESRPARLLDLRDYCKLHIIAHYVAILLGARPGGQPFHVLPIGRVGRDQAGERLTAEMAAAGMDLRFIRVDDARPTTLGICFQYPDGSGGNITAIDAAASALTFEEIDRAEPLLAANPGLAMALAAPEVPLVTRRHLLAMATRHGALRAASLASAEAEEALQMGLLRSVDLLAVNEDEAAALLGEPLDPANLAPYLDRLHARLTALQPGMRIVLTVGKEGAYACDGGRWHYRPALSVPVVSTAGAGDALLAGVLAGLAIGLPFAAPGSAFASAFDLGVLLAAFSVTSPHTIHPGASAEALLALAHRLGLDIAEPLRSALAGTSPEPAGPARGT